MQRIKFLNVPMDVASMKETVRVIDERIKKRIFTQHVVVNVAKLVAMTKDAKLRESVESCDIINIDGMGIVWGARLLGFDIPERVSGVDLFFELLTLASQRGYPVFLLGAKERIVEKTVSILKEKYPKLIIAGFNHGYFWDDEERVVKKIKNSGARLLFVAISSPKKEIFINKWKQNLGVDFVMGVGGTFDVVAGKVKRAPVWMQNCGLEWLFRVIQEPRRMWKRYLVTNSIFLGMLLRAKFFGSNQ